jgi:hypothetical protein
LREGLGGLSLGLLELSLEVGGHPFLCLFGLGQSVLSFSALISDLRFEIRDPLAELGKLQLALLDLQIKLVTLALQLMDVVLHLSSRVRMGLPISQGLLELPLVVLRQLKFFGFKILDPLLELPLLEDVGTGQDLGLLVRGKVMR